MYPTLSDFTKDFFGFSIPLPIKMFGLFVAIAFVVAMYFLKRELVRREDAGWLKPFQEISWVGKAIGYGEIWLTGLVIILTGLLFSVWARNDFSITIDSENSPYFGVTLTDFAIALILAVVVAFLRYHFKTLKATSKPEMKVIEIWPHERVETLIGIALVAGIIGAKLFDGLENWSSYISHPINFIAFSGLTFYGGMIVAAIAILYYAHQKHIDKWQLADSASPALMLAYGIGRIGCHMAGDGDWGIVNSLSKPLNWLPDWLWSYTYPHNVSNQGIQISGCTGSHCFQLPEGVFPTSLYESVACVLLFLVLWQLRKVIYSPGKLFGIYLIMNGVERFFVELIRVNNKYDLGFIRPTQAELISLAMVILGIVVIACNRKIRLRQKEENQIK